MLITSTHANLEDVLCEKLTPSTHYRQAATQLVKRGGSNRFGHGLRIELRMRTLRQSLSELDKNISKLAKLKNSKVDLRDQADIQALFDYSVLVSQYVAEGRGSPEMAASMQIATCKVSTVSENGSVLSKGGWYARTLRKKANHVREWGALPERKQGKGATHPSLLDDPRILQAAEQFASSLTVGKVSTSSSERDVLC